jgi:predicted HicB family RNase H-like nuclease
MNTETKKHGNTEAQKGNQNAAKPPELKADGQLMIRCLLTDKSRWVQQSRVEGLKLTEWVIKALNAAIK